MSLNPITREEKFLAKAGGEDVGELKPITRREKFLAKLAGGGSGGGSVSWYDLKDRPFYDNGVKLIPILENPELAEVDGQFTYASAVEGIEVGKEYTIKYNGVDYVCTGRLGETEGLALVYFGNGEAMGFESGTEPFMVIIFPPEATAMIGAGMVVTPLDGATTVSISIYGKKADIKKLENMFLNLEWLPAEVRKEKTLYKNEALRIPSGGFFMEESALFDLVEYETYKVTFNGETYECVCEKTYGTYGDYQTEVYSIGNLTMKNGASDYDTSKEPFLYELSKVASIDYEMTNFTAYAYKNDDVSISVVGPVFEAEPLPEKFLPAGGGSGGSSSGAAMVVTITLNAEGTVYSADKTFVEIAEAVENKQNVIAKFMVGSTIAMFYPLTAFIADTAANFELIGYTPQTNILSHSGIALMADNSIVKADKQIKDI